MFLVWSSKPMRAISCRNQIVIRNVELMFEMEAERSLSVFLTSLNYEIVPESTFIPLKN